jgi:hypothetical protein
MPYSGKESGLLDHNRQAKLFGEYKQRGGKPFSSVAS